VAPLAAQGKTIQILAAAQCLLEQARIARAARPRVLIVTTATALDHWKQVGL
jgi:hypothetical protein